MPNSYRIVTQIQDQDDFAGSLTNDYYLKYSSGTGKFSLQPLSVSPGGSDGQVQYNNAGSFGGAALVTYATSGTILTAAAGATTDVPFAVNGAASQSGDLQQWKVNGTTKTYVNSSGRVVIRDSASASDFILTCASGLGIYGSASGIGIVYNSGNNWISVGSIGAQLASGMNLGWSSSSSLVAAASDTGIKRSSAGVVTITDGSTGSGSLLLNAASSSTVPMTVKGASSQSANLQEWQNSSGTVLSRFTYGGTLHVPSGSTGGTGAGLNFGTVADQHSLGWDSVYGYVTTRYSSVAQLAVGMNALFIPSGSALLWSSGTIPTNSADTGLKRSSAGIITVTNGSTGSGSLLLTAASAATTPCTIKGASAQSANLQEWQNSSGTVLANVTAAGVIKTDTINGITGSGVMTIASATSQNLTLTATSGTATLNRAGGANIAVSATIKLDNGTVTIGGNSFYMDNPDSVAGRCSWTTSVCAIWPVATGDVAFFGSGSFGSGSKVIFIGNATTAPTTNPTGGGILYCEGGALKFRGSSGTVTTVAPA